MSVQHVEVLAEEPSMETALRLLLPRLLGGATFEVYTHQCKGESQIISSSTSVESLRR